MNLSPEQIFEEYNKAQEYKDSLGSRGLREQSRINERFFIGDQWYGAKCGNDRPLVRHNIIKRIGDYKMSALLSGSIDIYYSAEGVPNTVGIKEDLKLRRTRAANKGNAVFQGERTTEEISFVMAALNDYQKTTAERLKLDNIAERALRNAYISGTGIVYTYWDDTVETGLYADDSKSVPIKGDIISECLPIENVCFGDPCEESVQKQPYIIIAAIRDIKDVLREAERYCPEAYEKLSENGDSGKATVLTKLFKEYDENGRTAVYAVRVANGVTVREKWDIGIRQYPIAKFCWDINQNSAYGSSEITYLIPNQIAINRMITAKVWSALSNGMPMMIVNGDIVDSEITNDPGQIIKVFGTNEDVAGAIRYVSPPSNGADYESIIEPLINNTLSHSGANAAALGDVNPDNTSAIIQLRNAAKLPLSLLQNRYFSFLEEVSRIWAEFWVRVYGNRMIKQNDENGTWYINFDGSRYEDLIISAKAELTFGNGYSEQDTVSILDKLYDKGAISTAQYLKRLPKGIIANVSELINESRENGNDRQ